MNQRRYQTIGKYGSLEEASEAHGEMEDIGGGEGYGVFALSDRELVIDSGTMADFLPAEEADDFARSSVSVLRFETPEDLRTYLRENAVVVDPQHRRRYGS